MDEHKQVVVVEDNQHVRHSIQQLLDYAGFQSRMYDTAEALLADDFGEPFFCVFDFRLPGLNGLQLVEHIRGIGYAVPVILMSGNFDPLTGERVADLGNVTCIQKPFRPDDFFKIIEKMTELSNDSVAHPKENAS